MGNKSIPQNHRNLNKQPYEHIEKPGVSVRFPGIIHMFT